MPFYLFRPLVTVNDGPTFIVVDNYYDADLASQAFVVQWRYVHFTANTEDLLPYRDLRIAGHAVETNPDVLDEYARRGDFDLAEIYRGLFR